MLALLPLALGLVPEMAKWIAGDKAGTVAAQAADIVRTVTGTEDPAAAAAVLQDPAKAMELRIALANIALEQERARLADVANARQQTVTLAQAGSGIAWAAPTISVVIVAGFFGCVVLLFMIERSWDERTANLLNVLFGALIPGFSQVANYWLGSSAGSKASGDAVRAIAAGTSNAPSPVTVAQAGTVNAAPQPSPAGTTADDLNTRELTRVR
jgi:hypothetical protein